MTREELHESILNKGSFLCVGLDPDLSRLPHSIPKTPEGVLNFLKVIVDATRDLCVAYKPNLAFFELLGVKGWHVFEEIIQYIGTEHFIIADAKRGDIGNTSSKYAEAFFDHFSCDAITVAPYMGEDSVKPFLKYKGKWAIILGLTSNTGSEDFQLLDTNEGKLFEVVIQKSSSWGTSDNLMFVVGATHPEQLETIRKIIPDHFLLVPGVGAQGGDLKAVCKAGLNSKIGLLINASRAILYASPMEDFAEQARLRATDYAEQMAGFIFHQK